ncbi:Gldg family protein [Algiphilus sp. W345]|uniref:Gldg family protein n=1 Tax=Banduia mediterranea TaxID=3075609 RepID=A0ABU2WDT8_9GAMM|nr:Gldg family protein [Algiphilus sp. W345]MDT0495764.1 Gldg family protein [Algiphilus sp. W345]
MNKNPQHKKPHLSQHLLTILLVPAIILALGWLSVRYQTDFDWTAGNRNSLTEASERLLDAMPDEIVFTAYVYPDGEQQRLIELDLRRYQRLKDNIRIDYVDPSRNPQQTQEAGITMAGEVVASYQGRTETLRELTEPVVSAALQRLSASSEQWIVFLEGHGERAIDGQEPGAFGRFAETLKSKGLKARGLNLAATPTIPDNTSVLVIASPQRALLPGEVELIRQYVDGGGNLIWLSDPDSAPIPGLAETLGVNWLSGIAVFPDFQYTSGDPAVLLANQYPPHPITRQLAYISMFPYVHSLEAKPDSGWTALPIVQTGPVAWLESGDLSQAVDFDPQSGDVGGPLNVAMSLTRNVEPPKADDGDGDGDESETAKARQQRVILVGDADFASNVYYEQVGNSELSINLVQWAAARDKQLDINVPKVPDSSLYLPNWLLYLLILGFVIVLPLALIVFGVIRWAVRRRR